MYAIRSYYDQKNEVETYGQKAKEIYQERSQEEVLDAINVLYVALTRAEEQLYIVSNYLVNKTGLPNNLSSYFLEFLQLNKGFKEEQRTIAFGDPNRVSTIHKTIGKQGQIEVVAEKFRITSYNVCYTKLLRVFLKTLPFFN